MMIHSVNTSLLVFKQQYVKDSEIINYVYPFLKNKKLQFVSAAGIKSKAKGEGVIGSDKPISHTFNLFRMFSVITTLFIDFWKINFVAFFQNYPS